MKKSYFELFSTDCKVSQYFTVQKLAGVTCLRVHHRPPYQAPLASRTFPAQLGNAECGTQIHFVVRVATGGGP